jgi:hypothetical protein
MDAHLIESMFSEDFSLGNLAPTLRELDELDREKVNLIFEYMARICPREADIVELHVLRGVSQGTLAKIFGFTQPNIHYRVRRGLDRIKTLLQIPLYDEEFLEEALEGLFKDPKDAEVMTKLYLWSSQSKVARMVNESQGKIRYRFIRCLKVLASNPELEELHQAFKMIGENLSLLRGVKKEEDEIKVIL